jgi:transposase
MPGPGFDNIFNKMKEVTNKAASETNKAAKAAKLKMTVMSLNTEKTRHLQTVGQRTYTLFIENQSINGKLLQEKVLEELKQIERIEERIKELEAEVAELQGQPVNVTDVTGGGEGTSTEDNR